MVTEPQFIENTTARRCVQNQSMANLIDGISNDLSILAFEAGKRSLAVKLVTNEHVHMPPLYKALSL